MAECLAPGVVSAKNIYTIFVKTGKCEAKVNKMVNKYKLDAFVNNRPNMFPKIR